MAQYVDDLNNNSICIIMITVVKAIRFINRNIENTRFNGYIYINCR